MKDSGGNPSTLAAPSRPLGLLVIGRKRPGFDQEWNQIMRQQAQRALVESRIPVVMCDQPAIDDQTMIAALNHLSQQGCATLVVLQPSLGNGQLAFTLMQHWKRPVVLWATPEQADSPIVSSCSLVAQHLWASLFRHSERAFEFVYGHPQDAKAREDLRRAVLICQAPAELAATKVGLLGSQAPGFVSMHADPFLLNQCLDVQLANLSLPMFMDRVSKIEQNRVDEDVRKVLELDWTTNDVGPDDLPLNSRYYLAMRDLIAEEELQALALQCWPEFGNLIGQWPYLALTRLTGEGFIASMEGDVDGALTCLMGKLLDAGIGFITDWLEHDAETIHFWHGGVAPLPMCTAPSLSKHFNTAKPLVVDGTLNVDMPVTIARLWRCDGKYHFTAFEGRTIPVRRQLTGNTALVQTTGMDVPQWFDAMLHAGMPHHVILFASHQAEMFRRLARLLDIDWVSV